MLHPASMQPPTIDDIRAAARRIEGAVIRTPMQVSRTLSEIIGAEVWLKFENLQFTAAYKERGALNKLLQQTEEHGAKVILHGEVVDEAFARAFELEKQDGYVFVHAFDDPKIIAGQGTAALEMLEDAPDLDMLVVPIGGGGLMSGTAIAARSVKPEIELLGVEAELYPSMKCAIEGSNLPVGGDTLAEGIAVKRPGVLTSRILSSYNVPV